MQPKFSRTDPPYDRILDYDKRDDDAHRWIIEFSSPCVNDRTHKRIRIPCRIDSRVDQ